MKPNWRFWVFYTAAWLFYAASLGVVFVSVGYPIDFALLPPIIRNVAPAFVLGVGVVRLCRKLPFNRSGTAAFIFVHSIALFLFPITWAFLTIINLSVLNFLQTGAWNLVVWGGYALQWQFFSGLMAYLTIASAVYVGETNAHLQAETRRSAGLELRAARAEAARTQAELVALRAQLNPHFLFNTLHSLMALVRSDQSQAEEAIERFALMLRYVLQAQSETGAGDADVTFADEWRFVQNYLELESLRLGDRLRVESRIQDEALHFKLPAFVVQPLVENAIKHAVAARKDGGKISVAARVKNERLHIEIADDGRGASREEIESADGLGLRLVRESLAARFGGESAFNYHSAPGAGFAVSIEIPKTFNGGKNHQ